MDRLEACFYGQDLYKACYDGNMETVKKALDKGADVNTKDNDGDTCLMRAGNYGHIEIVSLLLEKGADVNARDEQFGWTAFMWACQKRYTEIVSMLLNNGADVNAMTDSGYTALKLATMGNLCVSKATIARSVAKYHEDVVAVIIKHIHDKLMEEILNTALIVKKGLTQKRNELLVPYAQRETIRHIASFF